MTTLHVFQVIASFIACLVSAGVCFIAMGNEARVEARRDV